MGGTRNLYTKSFRKNGAIHMSNYMRKLRIGDYVDIMVDSAIHKAMPHYFYHGKTGRIFNMNKRSVGVIVNKQVRNRIIPKRMHVRVEHVGQSNVRTAFAARIKKNDEAKREANKAGKKISTKRVTAGPREETTVQCTIKKLVTRNHKPYIDLY